MIHRIKALVGQSVIYGAGNLITKASGLILLPIYLNYITKEEFGLLALFETVFMFLLVISGWGAKGGFTRWYYEMKTDHNRRSLFFTTYVFNVFTSTIGVALTAIALWNLPLFHYQEGSNVLYWFCCSSLFRLLFDVPFILLKLQQKAMKQTAYQAFNVVLTIVFTFLFMEIREEGFEGIFKAQMVANGLSFLVIIPLIIKNVYLRFQKKVLVEMVHYGYPLAISGILTLILTMSDRYIIEHYQTLEEVGSFSMAYKISNVLQFLVVSSFVTSYTYNYYKSMHQNDGSRFHVKTFTYFVFMMTILGIGIVFFAREIIYILGAGKTEFYDAIPLIPILVLGLIFSGMRQVFVLPITKAKKTRLISIILILTGLLNVGLNFLVIPYWGKVGAAITTSISQLFAAIWFLWEVRKLEETVYETKKILSVLIVGVLICFIFFYVPSYSFLVDLLFKCFLAAVFLLLLFWVKFFEEVEITRLKQGWKKWSQLSKILDNLKSLKK